MSQYHEFFEGIKSLDSLFSEEQSPEGNKLPRILKINSNRFETFITKETRFSVTYYGNNIFNLQFKTFCEILAF